MNVLRSRVTADDRELVLSQLCGPPGRRPGFWARYAVMLTLSAVIATAGLSAGSTAVVIGAMLVAPLMTPLLGAVAALCLRETSLAVTAGLIIVASSFWVVAVAWVLSAALPPVPLSPEVLARTSPDVRDLLVALAAGVAGAWAAARTDVSATLPGVAVAVALVPPLAATGIVANVAEWSLVEGTALLYVTNVVAIAGAAFVVFLALGLVPSAVVRRTWLWLGVTAVVAVCSVAALSWPLWSRASELAERARFDMAVAAVVGEWAAAVPGAEVVAIRWEGSAVTVDVAAADNPPTASDLARFFEVKFGQRWDVQVRWAPRLGEADIEFDAEPDPTLLRLRAEVESWVESKGRTDVSVLEVTVDGSTVTVAVAGERRPPPTTELDMAVKELLGDPNAQLVLLWSELVIVDADRRRADVFATLVAAAARAWAVSVDLEVIELDASFDAVTVTVAGPHRPDDAAGLAVVVADLAAESGLMVVPKLAVRFDLRVKVPTVAVSTTTPLEIIDEIGVAP